MYKSPKYNRSVSQYKLKISQAGHDANSWSGKPLDHIYVGISGISERFGPRIAIAISDSTCVIDCLEYGFTYSESTMPCSVICDSIITELERYSRTYMEKIVGVALPKEIDEILPDLCFRLWTQLDCIPLVLDRHQKRRQRADQGFYATFQGWNAKSLDEQADSMVRKCIRSFGPGNIPHLDIGIGGVVEMDSAFHAHIVRERDFQSTVTAETWSLIQHYAADLKRRAVKIAIFSAAPSGKPNTNTINAILRLSHCLGTDIRWYVPDPSPKVSCIVGKMQNMLQGLPSPEAELTSAERLQLLGWVYENAKRHWLCPTGTLCRALEGGANVVIIDDPALSALALISKEHDPNRPVIFQSRMTIHDGSVGSTDSLQAQAFSFMWSTLKHADILAWQAQSQLRSPLVPKSKVGHMLASVDKFDGLNKTIEDWDVAFYGRHFNASCRDVGTATIDYPHDQYILVQLSHRPSFPQVSAALAAYRQYCDMFKSSNSPSNMAKLLLCGRHGVGRTNEQFYEYLQSHIALEMTDLLDLICIKEIGPPDQVWNTLLSKAKAVILLPDNEDFEEIFLMAVQKGKKVIRTEKLGPYSSLLNNDENVSVVDLGDTQAMVQCLCGIQMDGKQCQKVRTAGNEIWDEVTMVGNALTLLFLASALSNGEAVEPNGEYIYHLAQKGKLRHSHF